MVVSKDGGATWNATQIPGITDQVFATALAIVDGKVHLALTSGDDQARYLSGPVGDVSSWKTQPLPSSSGWKQPQNVNVSLTIDPSGKAVIAWFENQEEGDGHRYKLWRDGGSRDHGARDQERCGFPEPRAHGRRREVWSAGGSAAR